ncbi:MAG: AlkZ family DNA glycosylase [Actinobacteria bacterium]|nr:AlkZ family DNA glycosylase [Actinomycetota bacterium]MBO0787638.1 AlkZ family DNA glycosylase [Actinomycetota bacterium]
MDPDPVSAQRLVSQLLAGSPASSPAEVAGRLLAIQAQDPRGARLAIRARSTGLTAADVDSALTAERSVVVTWLNRGTLHLVRSEDYWWLHALTTPRLLTGNSRRLAQEGVPPGDAGRAVAVVERALAAEGPLTRQQLGSRIAAAGVRTKGQALVHILGLAAFRGLTVRGPVTSGGQAYALTRDWLGAPPRRFDRDRALAELARRYLAGHGPASDRDLARWSGLPLADARRGLSQIASKLADREDGLAELAGRPPAPPQPAPPRLLGAFEPLLLGWASRDPVVGPHAAAIVSGGVFRPFALVAGQAAATWSIAAGEVVLTPLTVLSEADSAALRADAGDVRRFLALA